MQGIFIHNNFLLQSTLAEELYHSAAKELPIIDFHNHLNPKDMATNRAFANMADAWVIYDPYKHRAMRICGIPENSITGNASDQEKFMTWASTLPKTLGNPLYTWSALELKRIFDIDEPLNAKNSRAFYEKCNQQLQQNGFGAVDILKQFNAEILCTSDDLLDNLSYHQQASDNHNIKVLPSLRGDSILAFDQPNFISWFENLQNQSNQSINTLNDYKDAVVIMLERFSSAGCRFADHSFDSGFNFKQSSELSATQIFRKWRKGNQSDVGELEELKNHMLFFLGKEYARRKWILQLHIGAQRFTSSRLRKLAGPAGGYATIGNSFNIAGLCSFFDELEKLGYLPKTILYTLNPADNEAFATLTGSYAEDGVPGKVQFGPAWWYNDHYEGIRQQLTALASYGILTQFIGMTTDSRSVFSFSRHEYFRRILCNLLADWVNQGNLPHDTGLLSGLVKDISYYNSRNILSDNDL